MPQGVIKLTGLDAVIRSGTMTMTHGVQPSVAVLEVAVNQDVIAGNFGEFGDLIFEYENVQLVWENARIDRVAMNHTKGGTTASLKVLDRRWTWELATPISGLYNVLLSDGSVDPDTEKTPRELATLLFEAMGEDGYSVDDLPNETRPQQDWIDDSPAQELATLCAELGCDVVPQLDGTFAIRKLGQGAALPVTTLEQGVGVTFVSEAIPEKAMVSGALERYQSKWKLEAVGKQLDGDIVPIADLTYRPANGFQSPDTMLDVEDATQNLSESDRKKANRLAVQWVYRAYRPFQLAEGTLNVAGSVLGITQLKQILPFYPTLIETDLNEEGVEVELEPEITGKFYSNSAGDQVDEFSFYDGNFRIDNQRGIVFFSHPVFRYDDNGNIEEADLRLTVAFNVRTPEDGRLVTRVEGPIDQNGTGFAVIKKPELEFRYLSIYDGDTRTSVINNVDEVKEEADKYIAELRREFNGETGSDVPYAGLVPIQLDGAIQQVEYRIDKNTGTTTRASRQGEFPSLSPSRKERKRLERIARLEKRADNITNWRQRRKDRI